MTSVGNCLNDVIENKLTKFRADNTAKVSCGSKFWSHTFLRVHSSVPLPPLLNDAPAETSCGSGLRVVAVGAQSGVVGLASFVITNPNVLARAVLFRIPTQSVYLQSWRHHGDCSWQNDGPGIHCCRQRHLRLLWTTRDDVLPVTRRWSTRRTTLATAMRLNGTRVWLPSRQQFQHHLIWTSWTTLCLQKHPEHFRL